MKNSNPVSRKRQAGSIRNTVIVVVLLLILVAFAPGYYERYSEQQHNLELARNMLLASNAARKVIDGNVARTGSVAGSGKGVVLPPNQMNTPHHSRSASAVIEWTVSDDGHIRGRNTQEEKYFGVIVEWIPALDGRRVVWSCKVTFPTRYSTLAPPPCPEVL